MSFRSYASSFSPQVELLLHQTHNLVCECLPGCSLRSVYDVPFYYLQKRVCYLGVENEEVRVGFCRGWKLDDPGNWLGAKDRKVIRHFQFREWNESNAERLKFFLLQAYDLDRAIS